MRSGSRPSLTTTERTIATPLLPLPLRTEKDRGQLTVLLTSHVTDPMHGTIREAIREAIREVIREVIREEMQRRCTRAGRAASVTAVLLRCAQRHTETRRGAAPLLCHVGSRAPKVAVGTERQVITETHRERHRETHRERLRGAESATLKWGRPRPSTASLLAPGGRESETD